MASPLCEVVPVTAPAGARTLEYMRFRLEWPPQCDIDGDRFEEFFGPLKIRALVNGEAIRTARLLDCAELPVRFDDGGLAFSLYGLALDYPISPGDQITAILETDEPFVTPTGFTLTVECSIVGEMELETYRAWELKR
jgi:hypothetical protein